MITSSSAPNHSDRQVSFFSPVSEMGRSLLTVLSDRRSYDHTRAINEGGADQAVTMSLVLQWHMHRYQLYHDGVENWSMLESAVFNAPFEQVQRAQRELLNYKYIVVAPRSHIPSNAFAVSDVLSNAEKVKKILLVRK